MKTRIDTGLRLGSGCRMGWIQSLLLGMKTRIDTGLRPLPTKALGVVKTVLGMKTRIDTGLRPLHMYHRASAEPYTRNENQD